MGNETLFSHNYKTAQITDCTPKIRSSIRELQSALQIPIGVYKYNDFTIASLTVHVNLPSRGTVNGIDIREQEPILIFFHEKEYPGKAPQIRIDRLDFPADQLPHLNPVRIGEPYYLCLHRGIIDDWYAEHSIVELVERAQKWLEDASKGQLIKQGLDRFEATRIDVAHWIGGVSIFDHSLFEAYIRTAQSKNHGGGIAYVSNYLTGSSDMIEWFRLYSNFIAPTIAELSKRAENYSLYRRDNWYPGVMVWSAEGHVIDKYFGALPGTLGELYKFTGEFDFSIEALLTQALNENHQVFRDIVPIFLCIQRPLQLIHSDSSLEIISFLLFVKSSGLIVVHQREPLTTSFAQHISGISSLTSSKLLLLGCGALGSKIGLHLGRAGITDLTLVDDDSLSPHNLVRHALLNGSTGQNKAKALEAAIKDIYRDSHQVINTSGSPANAFDILNDKDSPILKGRQLIVDATASVAVFSTLAEINNTHIPPVVRCELADNGRLGVALIEGRGRSPNIDDLRASLYDMAIENSHIGHWLCSFKNQADDEFGAGLEEITIGVGCSSPTMKISDDMISFHAASQAVTIRHLLMDTASAAGIQISYIEDTPFHQGMVYFIPVEKYKTLIPHQGNDWRIRIKQSIFDYLIQRAQEAAPNETGGLLVGHINFRRKIIFVTRQIPAPSDSESRPYAFKIGVRDVPEQVSAIMSRSGNLIRYVGEWHSHPKGSSNLSDTDKEAMNQLRSNLSPIGMPTHIMIVKPNGCYSHIFPPE